MNNKKGFTLVEIIVVIVIIGIILIIAIPNILDAIHENRRESGKSIEKVLLRNLELYNNDHIDDLWIKESNNKNCTNVDISELLNINPDIKLGECLLNNGENSLIIRKESSNKYSYQVGITCGKGLTADKDNKYLLANDSKGDVYYESRSVACDGNFTLTAVLNSGRVTNTQNIWSWDESTDYATLAANSGNQYQLPEVTREGYLFKGWYVDKEGTKKYSEDYQANPEINKIYAIWEDIRGTSDLTFEDQPIVVYYSENTQKRSITAFSGGVPPYNYEETSEKDSNNNSTNYITINGSNVSITGGTPVGEYKYEVKAVDTAGHTKTGTITVKVITDDLGARCPTILDNNKTYDGQAHSITVRNNAIGGTVQYRTSTTGEWTTTKPTRTNAGTTTIYVRLVPGNSSLDIVDCGSKTITINPQKCASPTSVAVSTGGRVTWTNSSTSACSTHQVKVASGSYATATSGVDKNSDITSATGSRNISVIAKAPNSNYTDSDATSKSVTVYEITFASNNTNFGTISPTSKNVISGATLATSGNNLLIEGVTSGTTTTTLATITPTPKTNYKFSSWSKTIGSLTSTQTITGTFNPNTYTVNVVVINGTVNPSSKTADYNTSPTFTLTPSTSGADGTVTCTNSQTANISGTTLTVNNVKNNTTCTVTFTSNITTLFTDGTLIINEKMSDRSSNITKHGAVTNEYEALSNSNAYVFSNSLSQPWYKQKTSISRVEIGQKIEPISTANWFNSLVNMSYGDFTNLDTSNTIDMNSMFEETAGLYSEVTSFTLIGLDNLDTSKVTDMQGVFQRTGHNAKEWSIGDLSNWDTSSVSDMSLMFKDAGASATTWSIGDLSIWDTSSVTNMENMFSFAGYKASTISIFDLSKWDVSSVTNMENMFSHAWGNVNANYVIDLSTWDVSKVTTMKGMFSSFMGRSLTLDLSNWDVSKVKDMSLMFSGANNPNKANCSYIIRGLSNWDVSSVTDMSSMFDASGYNESTWDIGDLSNWDVSSVTDMSSMFDSSGREYSNWSIGDLSTWDVSKVTTMKSMFFTAGLNATNWSIGDLSTWDTSSVTNMSLMFQDAGDNAVTWNSIGTLKVYATSITQMFDYISKAKATVNIYSNPTNYSAAFYEAATASDSLITVNYSSTTTNIDNIIATKSSNSNVVKGSQLD